MPTPAARSSASGGRLFLRPAHRSYVPMKKSGESIFSTFNSQFSILNSLRRREPGNVLSFDSQNMPGTFLIASISSCVFETDLLFARGAQLRGLPESFVKVGEFREMIGFEVVGPEDEQVMLRQFGTFFLDRDKTRECVLVRRTRLGVAAVRAFSGRGSFWSAAKPTRPRRVPATGHTHRTGRRNELRLFQIPASERSSIFQTFLFSLLKTNPPAAFPGRYLSHSPDL